MKKLLGLLAVGLVVGCSSAPPPVVVPQPPAPSDPSAAHQVCITLGQDTAYCVRSEKAPNGTTRYELISK